MKLFHRKKVETAAQRFEHLLDQGELPSFPSVVADAIAEISRPDVDMARVAAVIAADPKLTVRVLSLVNSPAFAPRSPITNVHQAVVLLGRNQLEALLIASGVASTMPGDPTLGYSPKRFWMEAAQRAAAAAGMAALVAPGTQYDQFTAALLQDMAQPILLHHDRSYVDLLVASGDSHSELAAREQEVLGWTHPEIGGLMCRHWGLPDALGASVSSHHADASDNFEIAQWASRIEGDDTDVDALVEDAIERFGVAPEAVHDVLERAAARAAEIAAAFA